MIMTGIMDGTDAIVEAVRLAVASIPEDTIEALKRAYEREENELALFNLSNILRTIEIGRRRHVPVCQDTGILNFFVDAGVESPHLRHLKGWIIDGTKRATSEVPLRPNAVDVLTGRNSGDNVGRFVPVIHWRLTEGDKVRIAVLPKGGGSENCSMLEMLTPSDGLDAVKDVVIRRVRECGGKPCPPIILGIGIGGGADTAVEIAKRALLRRVGERNPDGRLAELEEEILDEVNGLGIGPMGLGGRTTALDVKIEVAHRHPASFPVAIVFQCWANRRAFLEIEADGEVRIWQ